MSDPVAALKRRRPARGAAQPPPITPQTSTDAALVRANPVLFDPTEMPVVVESNGFVAPADHSGFYLRAEVDGVRHIVPDGCRTPVAQTLWTRGQHVRRDVYLTYLTEIGHELPEPYRRAPTHDEED